MDISDMLIGSSDQLDNVDLLSGPQDFTITAVAGGSSEQPLNITLAEYPRPWRPGLTMRRLLAAAWNTTDASQFVGRRVRLYRDPDVSFGKDKTGGTRISHMSHLEKPVTVSLPVSRGKFGAFTVEPLDTAKPIVQTEPTVDEVAVCTDRDELKAMWKRSGTALRKVIEARVAELETVVPLVGGSVSSPPAEPPTGDDGTLADGKW